MRIELIFFIDQIEWMEFANVLASKLDVEDEDSFKETFRVFSKNDEGCIPADEMKFVLSQICSVQVQLLLLITIFDSLDSFVKHLFSYHQLNFGLLKSRISR